MVGVNEAKIVKRNPTRGMAGAVGRRIVLLIGVLALLLSLAGPALAGEKDVFPETIPLPNGFRPEGIVIGRGVNFYVGSLANGSIYHGNLRTGEGEILVTPEEGRVAVGLAYDRRTNYIYTAGGAGGAGYVYDAETGESVAAFQFTSEETFVNDVVVTRRAAYFTDSSRPYLYRVPLAMDGTLPDPAEVQEILLGGDFTFVPGEFNTNGIDAPRHGRWLVIVNSFLGALYRVDPETGQASQIDLGGDSVPRGDGIMLDGRTLYVVQNFLNQISVIELEPRANSGEVEKVITSPLFRIPTTVDDFGKALYVVNARFDTPPTPETEYEVVRVPKKGD
jgi:sugar lactone lactonase YvrE